MNEYLYKKLKEGRIAKGLKQSDVTQKTGIKNTTLSNYENGVTEPDIDTFLNLCELYELDFISIIEEAYGISVPGKNFNIRPSEITYITRYRDLDEAGKEHLNTALTWEEERMKALEANKTAASSQSTRLINYYYRLASAGTGQIIFDTPPTKHIEIPDIPKYSRVSYAIGVNGNSMMPTYNDGDLLLVEITQDIEPGDIGIFLVNGESFVKQLGNGELISLNENYGPIPLTEDSRCLGKVIERFTEE